MTFRRLLLGLLLVLAALYAAVPPLASFILPRLLVSSGVSASHFSVGYPGWSGIDVGSFEMRIGDVAIAGERAHVAYRPLRLLGGRVDAVTLGRLTVRLGGDESAAPPAPFEIPPLWSLVPAERVSIEQLDFASVNPSAAAHGTLRFDPEVLEAHLDVSSPLLALPVTVNAATYPDGRLEVAVTQSGVAQPLLAVTGVPDTKQGVFAIDGRVELSGAPLALVAAYAQTTLTTGRISIQMKGAGPWPLPIDSAWRHFNGEGRYAVELQGQMPKVPDLFVQLRGAVAIHDGTVAAQLDAGSVLHADVPAMQALSGAHHVPHVTLTADEVIDIDYAEEGLRVGDGLVLSVPVGGSSLDLRVRGARSVDGQVEVAVTTIDGAPVVLATAGAPGAGKDGKSVAVHAHVALAGKLLALLAGGFGVTGAAGHAVADFDGAIPWPAVELQNVSGKGRIELASTGQIGAARTFDTAIDVAYTLQGGRLVAAVAPGAHVLLKADAVEATTIGEVTIEVLLDQARIDALHVDFKLALPEIQVGKRKVTLNDAWVTVERLSRNGDAVAAELVVRTHAGRDAQPIRVALTHDLAKQVGKFDLGIDWEAKKTLLAAQLPGFSAPYDVDEGTLRVALKGGWDLARRPVLKGGGRVRLDARRAHYEDYAVSGMTADLPITIENDTYVVAAAPVLIDTIDVGFPLTQIALNLAIENKIAAVRDLHGAVFGGHFSADPFAYALATDEADIRLRVAAIELAQVLALEGDDVQGSGVLDGELPVQLAGEAMSVHDGTIAARAPGGTLVYKGAAASTLVAQSGMGFVFQALEDFRYDVLDAKVALSADGALVLAVRLRGRNPAVENGRTIAFNLNLNESLPALLQSLRAADGITKQIEGKLSQ